MQRARALLIAVAVALLVLAWRLGLFALVRDPEALRAALLDLGAWGYVAFVLLFGLLQPLGLPGIGLVFGATYVWPKPVAYALSVLGSTLASAVGFFFARFVAREWVSAKLPERFRRYDERLGERGFGSVFLVRLVLWMNPFLHALSGLSKMRFAPYLAGSFAAYMIVIGGAVWVSSSVLDYLKEQPRERLYLVAAVLLGLFALRKLLAWYLRGRAARRARAKT